jgi:hypothetical protein
MRAITTTDIEPLISELNGNVAAMARRLRCSRGAIQRRIDRSPALLTALEDARESMIDNTESALYKKILDGDTTAIIFFLKTRGKSRGYVERQEVTGKDGEEVGLVFKRLSAADEADIDAEIARLEGIIGIGREEALFAPGDQLPPGFDRSGLTRA